MCCLGLKACGVVGKSPPLDSSTRFSETHPTVLRMPEDLETPFMDHDVVMKPAECNQILGVGLTAL